MLNPEEVDEDNEEGGEGMGSGADAGAGHFVGVGGRADEDLDEEGWQRWVEPADAAATAAAAAPAPPATSASSGAKRNTEAEADTEDADDPFTCAICFSACVEPVVAACGQHSFCLCCLKAHVRRSLSRRAGGDSVVLCPTCREPMQQSEDKLRVNPAIRDAIAERARLRLGHAAT